ncbi:MAG: hypothetical protein AB8H86_06400 [Polyangiales bacterium]
MMRVFVVGALVLAGCAQTAPRLEPSQVPVSEAEGTNFVVRGVPYADYLEATGSELRLRAGVEVWIGAERADVVDVGHEGMLVRLSSALPVGAYDLRVSAAAEHFASAALQVVPVRAEDAGLDTSALARDASVSRDVASFDGAADGSSFDAAASDAAPSDAALDDAPRDDGPSLCASACDLANANARCRAGMCEIEDCDSGFEDCDSQPTNGCEINTLTAPNHCGACGLVCGVGEACVEGTCASMSGQIAAGRRHSCAVRAGEVYCWGRNSKGELGSALPAVSLEPILVPGLTDAVAVTAGDEFTCALHATGGVSCWGSNAKSALGDNGADRSEPRLVSGVADARGISAGSDFVCAQIRDGGVRCWGNNDRGQLGVDGDGESATPLSVTDIATAVDIGCGDAHACAVLASGEVMCWGGGASGGLGNGEGDDSDEPVRVLRLTDVSTVSAGRRFSCATRVGATSTVCWGEGSQGQLGNGLVLDSPSPVSVASVSGAAEVSLGLDFACYLLPSGDVHCWGRQTHGQLGTGFDANLSAPPSLPVIGDVVAIAAGEAHACALRSDGALFCWGRNNEGELGDGTTEEAPRPVQVADF